MLIKTIPVGHLETNCYVVTDEKSLKCAVIDPGDESNRILDYIESNNLKCEAILITHGHSDHVGAVETVAEDTGATTYIHKLDCGVEMNGGSVFTLPEGGKYYEEGDVVKVGALEFSVIETPGHTPGGVTLICEDAIFCGDTLFRGSCGRTDLPGGNINEEIRSLKRICLLNGNYEVYPGHMDSTTLERERNFNYYCRNALEK